MLIVKDGANVFTVPTELLCAVFDEPFHLEIASAFEGARVVTLASETVGQFIKFSFEKGETDDLGNGVVSLQEAGQYTARLFQSDPDENLWLFRIKVDGNPNAIPA